MDDLSKNILSKIKSSNLRPIPRYRFVLVNIFYWLMFIFTALLGGLIFGFLIVGFLKVDFEVISVLRPRLFMFLDILPVAWIVLFSVMMFVAYYGFHKTSTGYKYRMISIALLNIFISVVIGVVMYQTSLSHKIDKIMEINLGMYKQVFDRRENFWTRPKEGVLSGMIQEMVENGFFLETPRHEDYMVVVGDDTYMLLPKLEKGIRIKVIGDLMGDKIFMAEQIKLWEPGLLGPQFRPRNFERKPRR